VVGVAGTPKAAAAAKAGKKDPNTGQPSIVEGLKWRELRSGTETGKSLQSGARVDEAALPRFAKSGVAGPWNSLYEKTPNVSPGPANTGPKQANGWGSVGGWKPAKDPLRSKPKKG
jgi:hypothetical protein